MPASRTFKSVEYVQALERSATARGLTLKEVARKCGVAASVIDGMAAGRRPDLASLSVLCNWSGLSAENFWEETPREDTSFSADTLGDLIMAVVDAKVAGDAPKASKAERLMREHLKRLQAQLPGVHASRLY